MKKKRNCERTSKFCLATEFSDRFNMRILRLNFFKPISEEYKFYTDASASGTSGNC